MYILDHHIVMLYICYKYISIVHQYYFFIHKLRFINCVLPLLGDVNASSVNV